jgi:hypothetical protein
MQLGHIMSFQRSKTRGKLSRLKDARNSLLLNYCGFSLWLKGDFSRDLSQRYEHGASLAGGVQFNDSRRSAAQKTLM